ncbi:preprotein translocase subunit SecA [Cytobacillus firmus]|uniref:accessory Sec system translocase SecA2 n=1 Tax=Cytobacillus firmus TaxID=1399 RepID=UPI00077C13B6|nr:accessory Sec system translocase SecA2 [Cytobacillus firmus]MBG9544689.1 preprotein translocase subunit SecA [Cytobacillus firmus]MBG9554032.1 preprotein translocase subunit SecA [Cytobacillus firmus]MBG9558437.1 preprotein translocase subunit SecA [Cytobacillus firmus]MBG9577021.1 preprotein translocase subunit SecA [Cytobacillus firmus]MEC1894324.1 accessory Sec system translocase SecA2 [Cytobacillus firmus]
MLTKVKMMLSDSTREIKRLSKLSDAVNSREKEIQKLSDDELRQKTAMFMEDIKQGKSLEDIKIEAFSVVREAAKRVLGLRHYDVQLIGGFVLHEGSIAEMQTGEGKTLVSTLPSYLHALEGKGVHIITANEYLAKRDFEQMGRVHEFLGLKVGLNISQMSPEEKKEAYSAHITYGTGNEFGFDYLRDNMVYDINQKVQRKLHYAIVDEIDSILIDEARTPLIIANKSSLGTELFYITADLMKSFKPDAEYEFYPETKQIYLKDKGAYKIEAAFGIDNLYDAEHQDLLHNVMQSLRAYVVMKKDVDYIVKDGKIILIDKFTGRIMEGRTFSEGLHQALEAKEGLEVTEENETQATITIQNYFRMYGSLAGMTGSATPSKQEFSETYNLKVVTIPTNKPIQRSDEDDLIFKDYRSKINRIIKEVITLHELGRPILIGTTSIEQSEKLSDQLKKHSIKHHILNAKTEEDEARIISLAGQKGQVMIATNMAGRGTDILLGEGVKELGGLHIIGTERHESMRIDMQLRGRSGRQGDPGSSQFIVSLEDDLFINYDPDEMEKYLKKVKTNEAGLILSPDPNKFVRRVQETVEHSHHSSRSHLLKLDDVIDRQSKVIYSMRDRLLKAEASETFPEVTSYIKKYLLQIIDKYCIEDIASGEWSLNGLLEELSFVFIQFNIGLHDLQDIEKEEITDLVMKEYAELENQILSLQEEEELGSQLQRFMLQLIDANWIQHLEVMTIIKDGIHLRGYGQEDPYRLLENEALAEFNRLMFEIESGISLRFIEYLKSQFQASEE